MGLVIGAALGITILGTRGEERKRVIALFIVVFFVIFFWACYEQAGSSMNLFADKNTDLQRRLVHDSVELVPVGESRRHPALRAGLRVDLDDARQERTRSRRPRSRWCSASRCSAIGFLFMVIGGARADTGVLVSPLWLVAAYTFHTLRRALSLAGRPVVRDQGGAGALRVAAHGRVVPRERRGQQDRRLARRAHAHARAGACCAGRRLRRIHSARGATNHGFYMIFVVAGVLPPRCSCCSSFRCSSVSRQA